MLADSLPLDPEALAGTEIVCAQDIYCFIDPAVGFRAELPCSCRKADLRLWIVPCEGMHEGDIRAIVRKLAREAMKAGALCVRIEILPTEEA